MKKQLLLTNRTRSVVAVVAILAASRAFAAPLSIDKDGCYPVNIIRRVDKTGSLMTVATVGINGPGSVANLPEGAIDGGAGLVQWHGTTADSEGYLRVTLDTVYSIKKFEHLLGEFSPGQYEIRTSTSGFEGMTQTVGLTSASSGTKTDVLGTPVKARFIEYYWKGKGPTGVVQLLELRAYADATSNPFKIDTESGYDVLATGRATARFLNGGVGWYTAADSAEAIVDSDPATLLRGDGTQGTDAQILVDLGDTYRLVAVSLGFCQSQKWEHGAKIEISEDGSRFTRVFLQSSPITTKVISYAPITGRYVRITNYHSSPGVLSDFQAFATRAFSAD